MKTISLATFFKFVRNILLLIGMGGMLFFFAYPKKTSALVFGGKIMYVIYCTSSYNEMIIVGPPAWGYFIYEPYSTELFADYNVFEPGPWVLGNYVQGGVCVIGVCPYCYSIPAMGTITMVGTSLE